MFKIRTWEPGPVLGNLDLNKTLVGDPYSGTWTRTREPGPVLGNPDPYSFMYSSWFFVFYTQKFEYINEYWFRGWPNIDGTYGINESESFEVQVERVGNELEPPFITVCPVIDVWNYANLTYYPSIPDNLSDYVLCVRLYSSEFFQGLKKCLVTNPDMYSFIFNMDTAYSPQFLPTLTLLSEQEEKALDIGLWKRVFHERYGLCYTLDSKHWKR